MYEFYRTSLIGRSLVETIDNKVQDNTLTPEQAHYILSKFDEAIPTVFNASVVNNMNFKGNTLSYNYVDGVWKFVTKDFMMTINNRLFKAEYMKVVACDADTSMDTGRRRKRKM